MNKKTLNEIGLSYNSDKVSEHHNYLNLYDKYFTSIRNNNNQILEIGILHGDSIKMLKETIVILFSAAFYSIILLGVSVLAGCAEIDYIQYCARYPGKCN